MDKGDSMRETPKIRRYVCPNCKREMPEIRLTKEAICSGVTVKCKKCGKIVELFAKPIDKQV